MKTTVIKRATFSAGHRLFNPRFDEKKNLEVFGACSNPNYHGHNYILEVHVTGPVDSQTGMVMNLKAIKSVIEDEIVSKGDHRNLNIDVDFMSDIIPTTENLASRIFGILDQKIGTGLLSKVVLWESDNNRVEITREKGGGI